MKVQIIELEERLLKKINVKKKRLLQYASKLELTDDRVVKCSQELDELIYQFQMRENLHLFDQTSLKNGSFRKCHEAFSITIKQNDE